MTLTAQEAHYLTREGDMVDEICWRYYGRTEKTTEAVYRRNPFLAKHPAILPAMLLIVLPVVDSRNADGIKLWNYSTRTEAAAAATTSTASAKTTVATPNGFESCCANDVPEVQSANYLAVYVRNELGDFVIRRMHKKYFTMTVDENGEFGYGLVQETDVSMLL